MLRSRFLFAIMSLCFLFFAVSAARNVVTTAPAFNPSLLVSTVFGYSRVEPSRDMYHLGDYLLQVAHGYLSADIVVSNTAIDDDGLASEAQMTEWALAARTHAKEGLSHAPANAHLWTAYAWSNALVGDISKARMAMDRSRKLSPYNLPLAFDRMMFTSLLASYGGKGVTPLSASEIEGTRNDHKTLREFVGQAARAAAAQPELSEYLQSSNRSNQMPH